MSLEDLKDTKDTSGEEVTKADAASAPAIVTEDELKKSLDKIEQIVKSETPDARKDALLKKAVEGSLADDEGAELASLLKGEKTEDDGALSKALSPETDSDLAKSIDVAPALAELVSKLEKALGVVGETIEKSSSHQSEVNLVLAKGLHDTCKLALQTNELVKGLSNALDTFAGTPARGRKSAASASDVVHKSHAGEAAAEEQISKGQVLDLINAMVEDKVAKSEPLLAPCGEDLTKATALLESTGDVSPQLMQDLAKFRQGRLN